MDPSIPTGLFTFVTEGTTAYLKMDLPVDREDPAVDALEGRLPYQVRTQP